MRPIGGRIDPSRSPTPGVAITSGATVLTRTLRPPSSSANVRVRFSTPALAAPYNEYIGAARYASILVTLTMEPPSRNNGSNARVIHATDSRFSRSNVSSPFGDESANDEMNVPPALLTSTSTPPSSEPMRSAKELTASTSRTSSVALNVASPRLARPSLSRSHVATFAPYDARATTVARPIPAAPPVTTATLPLKSRPLTAAV
jgi:hypothetical protein